MLRAERYDLGAMKPATNIPSFLVCRNSPKLSFADWNKYLDEIAKNKGMEADAIKVKLVASGTPGFTGATVSKNMDS